MEEPADRVEGNLGDGVGAVEHVLADALPPGGDAVEEVDVVLAEEDEVVPGEDGAEGLGDGVAEVVGGRVEAGGDLLVAVGYELGEAVGGDCGEDGDRRCGDVGVGEVEIGANSGADGLPEVGGEASGADEIKGELFADGGGRGGDDLLAGGFGEGGDVLAGGGLLEGLEEGTGLAEGVVGAEICLDLGEEDVHGWELRLGFGQFEELREREREIEEGFGGGEEKY